MTSKHRRSDICEVDRVSASETFSCWGRVQSMAAFPRQGAVVSDEFYRKIGFGGIWFGYRLRTE